MKRSILSVAQLFLNSSADFVVSNRFLMLNKYVQVGRQSWSRALLATFLLKRKQPVTSTRPCRPAAICGCAYLNIYESVQQVRAMLLR